MTLSSDLQTPPAPSAGEDLHAALAYISKLKLQIESELAAGTTRSAISLAMTLADICDLYFKHNPRKVSAATIARDRISGNNLCRLLPADLRPDEIDDPAVIHYRNTREQEGARPRTILDEMSFLKMVLQFGMSWRRVTGMRTVSFVTVPDVGEWDHPGVALSIDEFREALTVLSPINRRRFIFGVTTMVRRTPLLSLNRAWIDLDAKWLSVPREFMKKGRSRGQIANLVHRPFIEGHMQEKSMPIFLEASLKMWSIHVIGA